MRRLCCTTVLVLCLLALGVRGAAAQADSCLPNELAVNQANAKTNFTVTNTVAVKVVNKDLKRCQMVILNRGETSVSCLPAWQGTPTPTVGVIILAGEQLAQQTSGRGEWWCIATTGTATTLLVLEELPNVP